MLNEEVNKCQRKIIKWRTKLKDLQDACPHTDAVKVNKADTGNWCPQDDSYWKECSCPTCGKDWVEDQ